MKMVPQPQRVESDFCYYAHKYLAFGGKIPEIFKNNGISLCQDIPRSPEEIAGILRSTKVLYCLEPSNIASEAHACGCQNVFIDTEYLRRFNTENIGMIRIAESQIEGPAHSGHRPK